MEWVGGIAYDGSELGLQSSLHNCLQSLKAELQKRTGLSDDLIESVYVLCLDAARANNDEDQKRCLTV